MCQSAARKMPRPCCCAANSLCHAERDPQVSQGGSIVLIRSRALGNECGDRPCQLARICAERAPPRPRALWDRLGGVGPSPAENGRTGRGKRLRRGKGSAACPHAEQVAGWVGRRPGGERGPNTWKGCGGAGNGKAYNEKSSEHASTAAV